MFTPRDISPVFGAPNDTASNNPDAAATLIALLKGTLAALPAISADPVVPRPVHRLRIPADAIGSPSDPVATDTTSSWTAISLLKGILFQIQAL